MSRTLHPSVRLLPLVGALVFLGGAFDDGCIIQITPVEPEDCDLACEFGLKHDVDGNAFCECRETDACIEIAAAPHTNPDTGECVSFPSVCDIPTGWEECGGGTCVRDGVTFAAGDEVPTDESCTTCRCRADGEIICTETPCQPTCEWNGQVYAAGESFPSGDGCNSCFCDESGLVACTAMWCGCEPGEDCGGCFVDDLYLDAGETVRLDDCTECTCLGNGELECVEYDGCWGCILDDGTHLAPGETIELGICEWCTCDESGELLCYAGDCFPYCEYQGELYDVGATFPAGDGCNTCTCDESGLVFCTEIACCIDENGDGACDEGCVYDGVTHQAGDVFPAGDGCNSCTCLDDGQVVCTLMACPAPYDCDESHAFCRSLPPICDEGYVPSIENGCWGECVPADQCAPKSQCEGTVVCAMPPPACDEGFVPTVENGCWGECIPVEDC